jgi:NAD-dependent deacetylase
MASINNFSSELVEKVASAVRIGVLTGAGISAESGIATFRGDDGIWKKFKPEELASMDAFMRNPELVWEWYEQRKKIIKEVKPNAAHKILADMEDHFPYFTICTQNIDSLHFRAGNKNVMELHGNILRTRCSRCGKVIFDIALEKGKGLPHCSCGGLFRPDVVWFGEMLPEDVLQQSFEVARGADIFFSIGTSAVVYPAAMLPTEAKRHGAYVIEINLEPTPLTNEADASFLGKAGEILPELWSTVKPFVQGKS